MEALIQAKVKNQSGKGVNRKLRSEGLIPAILYGPHQPTVSLILDQRITERMLILGAGRRIIDIEYRDEDTVEKCQAMFKSISRDPVSGRVIHIDFYAIKKGESIIKEVPVKIFGEAVGVKEEGGTQQFVTREVKIKCLPKDLPEFIEIDISELKIGDTIVAENLIISDNIQMMEEPERVIISILALRKIVEEVEEEELEEGEEGEEADEADEADEAKSEN